MKLKLKCPHCEVEIIEDDCCDMSLASDTCVVRDYIGHCPECKRKYGWSEFFDYRYTDDFGLIK